MRPQNPSGVRERAPSAPLGELPSSQEYRQVFPVALRRGPGAPSKCASVGDGRTLPILTSCGLGVLFFLKPGLDLRKHRTVRQSCRSPRTSLDFFHPAPCLSRNKVI